MQMVKQDVATAGHWVQATKENVRRQELDSALIVLPAKILQMATLVAPPQTVCVEDMEWLWASVMLLSVAVAAATVEKAVLASWAVPAFQRYPVMQHHSFSVDISLW